MRLKRITHAALILCALGLLSANPAWANADADAQPAAASAPPEQGSEAASGPAEGQAADGAAETHGDEAPTGLDIVMDGTSLEAWNQSMEKVKEVGGVKEYGQLQDAFEYLLMFDIGAKNNPEILASRLNGLTGNEILKRVKYGRGKNKKQTE